MRRSANSRKRRGGRREPVRPSDAEPRERPDADPESPQEQRAGRWRRLLRLFEGQVTLPGGIALTGAGKLGLVFIALFVLGLGVVKLAPWERKVKVPDLVGASRADAERRLAAADLMLSGIQYEASAEPAGTVVRTDPRVGSELDHESGVGLVLAMPVAAPQAPVVVQGGTLPPGRDSAPMAPGGNRAAGADSVARDEPGAAHSDNRADGSGVASGGGSTTKTAAPKPPDPTPTAVPPTTTPPQPKVLLGVGRADPDADQSSCATGYQTDFSQQVSMTGTGRVTYRWLRSDGSPGPVEYFDFTEPSTKVATTEWTRWGADGETLSGWQQLEVLGPVQALGDRISFEHRCPEARD